VFSSGVNLFEFIFLQLLIFKQFWEYSYLRLDSPKNHKCVWFVWIPWKSLSIVLEF